MVKKYIVVMILALILAVATIGTVSAGGGNPWESTGVECDTAKGSGDGAGILHFNHHNGSRMRCM